MPSVGLWPRVTDALARFVVVVLALSGLAAVVAAIFTRGTSGSYVDGLAGAMWLVGFIAALVVPGHLWGEIWAWGLDEPEERDKAQWKRPRWGLLPACVAVMAIGTIIYMLF